MGAYGEGSVRAVRDDRSADLSPGLLDQFYEKEAPGS